MSSSEVGIFTLKTEKVIKNSNNEHLKINFGGVYTWNYINKFVEFYKIMV